MSRHWREPFSIVKARQLEIRDYGGSVIIGQMRHDRTVLSRDSDGVLRPVTEHNVLSPLTDRYAEQMKLTPVNEWIYYVSVCRFTFAFFSTEEIPAYIRYYSLKILPSRTKRPHDTGHKSRQSRFNRLPLYLRQESKRLRVVKALEKAYADFHRQESTLPLVSEGAVYLSEQVVY